MNRPIGVLLVAMMLVVCASLSAVAMNPSYSSKIQVDTVPFFPNVTFDPSIPAPNTAFPEPIGIKAVRYDDLIAYLTELAAGSDRALFEVHGRSWEGRELYNLIISSPENMARLEDIRSANVRLGDPSPFASQADLDQHIADQPAIAWLGMSIHGDEMSGVDAGLLLAYRLIAGTDELTMRLLKNTVIILDPIQNPDGRERYLSMLQMYSTHTPNYDAAAMQHNAVWPYGRTNHYMFDLNRDWILQTQPETHGRCRTILDWQPHLVVDAHEMGPYSTYLFSPARQPVNYNTPEHLFRWWDVFSKDQAAAFDKNGWPYYTKEWHEHWYPGYGSAWPVFFGSIGILYEQARVDGVMTRQGANYALTFHESINHHLTSLVANLTTLVDNREQILKEYREARQQIVREGRRSQLTFLFAPDRDEIKMNRFIDRLLRQGIEVFQADRAFTVGQAKDIYGDRHSSKRFPKGTYIVSTAQPNGALAKAVLEFDPRLKLEFLEEERHYREKFRSSRLYEVTAWSASQAYDLDAYETTSGVSVDMSPVLGLEVSEGRLTNADAQVGFLIDMVGEKTYQALRLLFGHEVVVFAAEKPFVNDGRSYQAGTLLLRRRGNPENLPQIVQEIATSVGIDIHGTNTGFSIEGSHLGAPTFQMLVQPRVGLVTGSGMDYTSVGTLWFLIDRELELPHSLLAATSLSRMNLSKYNVLVVPQVWGSLDQLVGHYGAGELRDWVEAGGTLITMGRTSVWAADSTRGLSQVRRRRDVLTQLDDYARAVAKERAAEAPTVDTLALFDPAEVKKEEPEEQKATGGVPSDQLKEVDEWQRLFAPGGMVAVAELDPDHWLNFGMGDRVPVMLGTRTAFMSKYPVSTAARFADKNDLRAGGLLWPEARERWANTAYLTRERKGRGQIIMFADDPFFRAYWYGTRQLFVNALLYGPGMTGQRNPY